MDKCKNLFFFIMQEFLILLLSSCLMVESEESALLTSESILNSKPSATNSPEPTFTNTPLPSPTFTPLPTFTPTDTVEPTPSATPTPPSILACIQRYKAVNVRERPDTNSRRTSILSLGQCVTFIARSRDLIWAKFQDGWVQVKYFELSWSLEILPILEK